MPKTWAVWLLPAVKQFHLPAGPDGLRVTKTRSFLGEYGLYVPPSWSKASSLASGCHEKGCHSGPNWLPAEGLSASAAYLCRSRKGQIQRSLSSILFVRTSTALQ